MTKDQGRMPPDLLTRCWLLTGPTACGKTVLSLALAEKLDAEILALDSMTLYRGMDIGTAKPSAEERARVPHHLVDILDPHEEFSLADYVLAAEACCREIVARGKTPLFVGGTGLYLRGVLRGVFEGPEADWTLRQALEEQSRREGPAALHRELARVDSVTAARLHPNDLRRVIRAIEVFRLTGQPLSSQHDQRPRPLGQRTPHVYWLSPPRDWLYEQINARVEQMFVRGLIDEVLRLRQSPRPMSHTARQALGYKEVLDWLEDRGQRSEVRGQRSEIRGQELDGPSHKSRKQPRDLIELIQMRTRQFAKRQQTWFRNLEECVPVEIEGHESAAVLAERLASGALRHTHGD